MQNPAKNILLLLVVAFVAGVVVQSAKRIGHEGVPTTAIDAETVSSTKKEDSLSPTVIQPTPTSQQPAVVSPMHGSEQPHYRDDPVVTPIPDPTTAPAINGGLTTEPVEGSPGFEGAFPISTPAPTDSDAIDAEVPPESPAQPQTTSIIITGPDDSFWSISKNVYGSEAYYRALFLHNRREVLRPDQLRAGIELEIPPLAELRSLYPDAIPPAADVE